MYFGFLLLCWNIEKASQAVSLQRFWLANAQSTPEMRALRTEPQKTLRTWTHPLSLDFDDCKLLRATAACNFCSANHPPLYRASISSIHFEPKTIETPSISRDWYSPMHISFSSSGLSAAAFYGRLTSKLPRWIPYWVAIHYWQQPRIKYSQSSLIMLNHHQPLSIYDCESLMWAIHSSLW